MSSQTQQSLFPESPPAVPDRSSTNFVGNMRLPVHRWFRYSAGFSGAWAEHEIARAGGAKARVFDPFAGAATSLVAAEYCEAAAIGMDAHPFVARLAEAKLDHRSSAEAFVAWAKDAMGAARAIKPEIEAYPELIRRCYSDEALAELDSLRSAVLNAFDGSAASRLGWLTLTGILRQTSHAGTANWQYLLPDRRKSKVVSPFHAFELLSQVVAADMADSARLAGPPAQFIEGDARTCEGVPDDWATLILTSPPYPNNFDYADATRLEMTFFGEVERWSDLQNVVRQYLLRSCSQHVPERTVDLEAVLERSELAPIKTDLRAVCEELAEVRKTRSGKKTYHLMVACYFLDLAQVWTSLRRVCAAGSRACFVIGDSAPYGVYVPVVEWLSALATASGFHGATFEKTRDRNIKWKNRKHRVPLCEGRLWLDG